MVLKTDGFLIAILVVVTYSGKWVQLAAIETANPWRNDDAGENKVSVAKLGPCKAEVKGFGLINLEPISRKDGRPRFYSIFQIPRYPFGSWNYTFNPCLPFNEPEDLHSNSGNRFGDICSHVIVCKFQQVGKRYFYYPYAVQTQESPEFQASTDQNGHLNVNIIYSGTSSMILKTTRIELKCNKSLNNVHEALFIIKNDNEKYGFNAELHHICACPEECSNGIPKLNSEGLAITSGDDIASANNSDKTVKIYIIIGVNLGILMIASCVGVACYKQKNRLYNKVPSTGRNFSTSPSYLPTAMGSTEHMIGNGNYSMEKFEKLTKSNRSAYSDYEADTRLKKKLELPVLEDHVISKNNLELSQRLGGGRFSDTNVGHYSGTKVAVTRITLRIHDNQISKETLNWMKEEVWILSRQRHRHIVPVLGICIEDRLPYIISEYVDGQSVKYIIQNNADSLKWPLKIKICLEAADGMAYLHSTRPPILHRDLRCANLFINENENVKVADFGVTKLIQPLRDVCHDVECCCQGKYSSCAPSIRWTAPEVICNPTTHETDSDSPLTIYSDVYSYGICMWELAMGLDPFSESNEQEVIELVKKGRRPEIPENTMIFPQYKALMHQCWNSSPDNRPKFKQIATRLKDVMSAARSYQKNLTIKKRQKAVEMSIEVKS